MVHILFFAPRYNIGPQKRVPVIVADAKGVRQVEMKWGFKSDWSDKLHINAQSEKLKQTPTFSRLRHQPCLVPMDGFYEWKGDKTPVPFVRRRRDVFYVAALWKAVEKQELDEPVQEFSFVVLTRAADASVAPIHSRMPFIVREGQLDWWLKGDLPDTVLNFPSAPRWNGIPSAAK
jgi:putative SOS response-associated peptidase YedK